MMDDGLDIIRKRIKEKRAALGYSYQDVANLTGLSKSTLQRYETGSIGRIPLDKLEVLANALECPAEYLLGWSDEDEPDAFCGESGAGSAASALEQVPLALQKVNPTDHLFLDWQADFTLVCPDDSMAPSLKTGDLVAIRRQPRVENGEIAAVQTGQDVWLRRVYVKKAQQLVLQPENPAYEPTVLLGEEMNQVRIIGKVIGLCRRGL